MRIVTTLLLCLLTGVTALSQDNPGYTVPADAKFTITDVKIPRVVRMAKEEPVQFEIGASLRLPTGEKPETGWAGVLFISGSGSQSRHGFQGKLDLGSWELLDAIANAGFAVLSCDDRGIGETPIGEEGIDPTTLGYNELVGDAKAAFSYLANRPEIDPKRIFIIGHSEGGLTAPIIAGENEVAGVVFMAAAGRNIYDVTLMQVQDSIAGLTKAQQEQTMIVQREFQNAVKEDREPNFKILGDNALVVANLKTTWKNNVLPIKAWWHDHFVLDVPAVHAAMKCPCLITNGKSDFQVMADADAKQIVTNLMKSESSDVTLKLYDDLDHLFKPCGGRKSELKMYFEDRRVDPQYIKDVVAWLEAHD